MANSAKVQTQELQSELDRSCCVIEGRSAVGLAKFILRVSTLYTPRMMMLVKFVKM
jgi:hypothetical protein